MPARLPWREISTPKPVAARGARPKDRNGQLALGTDGARARRVPGGAAGRGAGWGVEIAGRARPGGRYARLRVGVRACLRVGGRCARLRVGAWASARGRPMRPSACGRGSTFAKKQVSPQLLQENFPSVRLARVGAPCGRRKPATNGAARCARVTPADPSPRWRFCRARLDNLGATNGARQCARLTRAERAADVRSAQPVLLTSRNHNPFSAPAGF